MISITLYYLLNLKLFEAPLSYEVAAKIFDILIVPLNVYAMLTLTVVSREKPYYEVVESNLTHVRHLGGLE